MATENLKAGSTVNDRYRIEGIIGHGDLGQTFTARDLSKDHGLVVLRTITGFDREQDMAALQHDLFTLSRFRHPHLCHVLDFGVTGDDSTPYVVREYVDGTDVFKRTTGWGPGQILQYLVQLCRVLEHLHERAVVHSRLKPSNLLLYEGERGELQLKILDFGLDRWSSKRRRAGWTVAYTAPEALLGHSLSSRSDLYSFGVLSYELFARRLPFDDDDQGYLVQKHLQGKPDMRPIERLADGPGLAQVLLSLLQKDPERRPSSAEDVVRLLSAASGRDFSGTVSAPVQTYFSAARMAGREREMGFFQERARQVRETGKGATVFLTGEGGSGKSRCFEELKTWALLDGWKVVEGACGGA